VKVTEHDNRVCKIQNQPIKMQLSRYHFHVQCGGKLGQKCELLCHSGNDNDCVFDKAVCRCDVCNLDIIETMRKVLLCVVR
jgi:hypothetical protein